MNKWMLTNFDLSFLWLRYREKLAGPMCGYDETKCGKQAPEYPIINLKLFGTPSTRRFRALKMWFVLRNYGVIGMQKYHRNHIFLSKVFERYVERDERFEVVGPTRVKKIKKKKLL
jgi:glutamate/tyrosine decarboxylase-like PLP-dependent enzyme